MRLVTYRAADTWHPGVLVGDVVVEAAEVLAGEPRPSPPAGALGTRHILAATPAEQRATAAAAEHAAHAGAHVVGSLDDIELDGPGVLHNAVVAPDTPSQRFKDEGARVAA